MDHMDRIAAAYVTPALAPGEVIRWIGCLLQPVSFNVLGVPQRYAHHVAVGTDRRLILTLAEAEFALVGTNAALSPNLGRELVSWWYDELGEIEMGPVEGVTSGVAHRFYPFQGCGPLRGEAQRYDAFGTTPGFSASAADGVAYLRWVAQTVAQRAFPVDPQKQPYVAAWHRSWPEQRARRQASRATSARRQLRVVATVIALAVAGVGAYEILNGQTCLDYSVSMRRTDEPILARWEQSLADVKRGKTPTCGRSHDECVCIDRAAVDKEPWLRTGRTPNDKKELCLGVAAIEGRVAESKKRLADVDALATNGMIKRIGGIAAVALAVVGLGLAFWKTRSSPA